MDGAILMQKQLQMSKLISSGKIFFEVTFEFLSACYFAIFLVDTLVDTLNPFKNKTFATTVETY